MSQSTRKSLWVVTLGVVISLTLSIILTQRQVSRPAGEESSPAVLSDGPVESVSASESLVSGDRKIPVTSAPDEIQQVEDEYDVDAGESIDVPLSTSEFPEIRLPHFRGTATTFASESRDPEWSSQTEGLIGDRISQSGISANTVQVSCRETLCRIYIDYPVGSDVSFETIAQISFTGLGIRDGAPAFFGFIDRLPVRVIYLYRGDESAP